MFQQVMGWSEIMAIPERRRARFADVGAFVGELYGVDLHPSLTPVSILSFQFNQLNMRKLSLALLSQDAIGWCYRNDNLLHGSINRSFVPQNAVFKANRRDRTLYR